MPLTELATMFGEEPLLARQRAFAAALSSNTAGPAEIFVDRSRPLIRELMERFSSLAIGEGPHVDLSVLAQGMGLGLNIIKHMRPLPHALNMTASSDGDLLFTLFGDNTREAELWISSQVPGRMAVIRIEGANLHEDSLPITEFEHVAEWLRGGAF